MYSSGNFLFVPDFASIFFRPSTDSAQIFSARASFSCRCGSMLNCRENGFENEVDWVLEAIVMSRVTTASTEQRTTVFREVWMRWSIMVIVEPRVGLRRGIMGRCRSKGGW